MAITINGTTGISGVDGSSSVPVFKGSDANTGISFGTDTVTINTGGTARVTTDASGNVGIGTASPSTYGQLAVVKNATGLTTVGVSNNGTTVDDGAKFSTYFGGVEISSIGHYWNGSSFINKISAYGTQTFIVDGSERMRIDISGNVGIGTSSPGTKLDVNGRIQAKSSTDPNLAIILNNTASGGREWQLVASSSGGLDGGGTLNMRDNTAGANRLTIDSSGNLLVGTTSLWATTGKFTLEQIGVQWARATNHTNAGNQYFDVFGYNGTSIGSITGNNTSVTYATSSDYRLKENVAPMQNALATVAQLKPCTYTWKADGSQGQGFIAHELQAVVPDCVTGEKDAVDKDGRPQYQGVDTSFLVATLTAAIQEQQSIITQLQADVAALKGAA